MIAHHFFNFFTFVGAAISGIIVLKMHRIEKLTFINKFLLIYFYIDTMHGFLLGFVSFNMYKRYILPSKLYPTTSEWMYIFSSESERPQNCTKFISLWMTGMLKSVLLSGLMMCRLVLFQLLNLCLRNCMIVVDLN